MKPEHLIGAFAAMLCGALPALADVAPTPPFRADSPDTYFLPASLIVGGVGLAGLGVLSLRKKAVNAKIIGSFAGAIALFGLAAASIVGPYNQYNQEVRNQEAFHQSRFQQLALEDKRRHDLGKQTVFMAKGDIKSGAMLLSNDFFTEQRDTVDNSPDTVHDMKLVDLHIAAKDIPQFSYLQNSMIGPEASEEMKKQAPKLRASTVVAEDADKFDAQGWELMRGLYSTSADEATAKMRKAVAMFSESIKRLPSGTNASYLGRAQAYNKLGEYDKGLTDADRAIAGHQNGHLERGEASFGLKKYDNAIRDADYALAHYEKLFAYSAYELRGRCHQSQQKLDEAIKDFDLAIANGPGDGYYYRYKAHRAAGHRELAIADLRQAKKDGEKLSADDTAFLNAAGQISDAEPATR